MDTGGVAAMAKYILQGKLTFTTDFSMYCSACLARLTLEQESSREVLPDWEPAPHEKTCVIQLARMVVGNAEAERIIQLANAFDG